MATSKTQNQHGYPDGPTTEPDFMHVTQGLRSWMLTLDHKRIGMMYLFGILIALIIGGAFALLVRTELFLPGKQLVAGDTYNQFFTLHGSVMVFLVIIPGIPAALGNIIMPIQLGAPDVAFPRLNLSSFYLWVSGALLLVLTIPFGSLDTGWTLYTPYSLETKTPVLIAVSGVFLLGFSIIYRVIHSPFGAVLTAIRENEIRTTSLGYNPDHYKLIAFVLSAALAGTAGATKALALQVASLTDVRWQASGEVVLMTLIGGLGRYTGPVVGAFFVAILEHYLAETRGLVPVIEGGVFVVFVLLFRQGIIGGLSNLLKLPL